MGRAKFSVHGARGSFPVSGEPFRKYGGHTSCFSVETAEGLLIIDAGSGLTALGADLAMRPSLPPMTILFTHLHLDHLIGLPAFRPLLDPKADVTLMADPAILGQWRQALATLIGKPFWPVELAALGASLRFEDLKAGSSAGLSRYGIRASWCPVSHPQGGTSYRLELPGHSLVLATDREHGNAALDAKFLDFCRGADTLIHDAQYLPEEYPGRIGWGHSTWQESVRVAKAAGAKALVLTSHDPIRTDDAIDRMTAAAAASFPAVRAAQEQTVLFESES